VGLSVGDRLGLAVGLAVGLSVGDRLGLAVGLAVGDLVGLAVVIVSIGILTSSHRHFCQIN
jgi:hypothetical protein